MKLVITERKQNRTKHPTKKILYICYYPSEQIDSTEEKWMLLRKVPFASQSISSETHPSTQWFVSRKLSGPGRVTSHQTQDTHGCGKSLEVTGTYTGVCVYGYKYKMLHSPWPPKLTLFVSATLAGSGGQGKKNILTSWCFDRCRRSMCAQAVVGAGMLCLPLYLCSAQIVVGRWSHTGSWGLFLQEVPNTFCSCLFL